MAAEYEIIVISDDDDDMEVDGGEVLGAEPIVAPQEEAVEEMEEGAWGVDFEDEVFDAENIEIQHYDDPDLHYYGADVRWQDVEDDLPIAADDGYASDTEGPNLVSAEILPRPIALAINPTTRICMIRSCYLTRAGDIVCSGCFLHNPEWHGQVSAYFNHEVGTYQQLGGYRCLCRICHVSISMIVAHTACQVCRQNRW